MAKSFALFLAKILHLSFSPLEGRWDHTFRCQKRCALGETVRVLRFNCSWCFADVNGISTALWVTAERFCSVRVYYRKRGSASYIVLEVRSVRESVWDGSDVTLVALKLAMNFAPFLAKVFHLSIGEEFYTFPCQKFATCITFYIVSPLFKGAEFTLSVAKNAALFEAVRVLRFASVKWRDMGSKNRNKRSNSGCTVLILIEKWIKLMPKTIGNRKRDCAWGCARRINTTSKNLQIEKQKSVRWAEWTFFFCAFRSADFPRWCLSSERNLTHNLFFYFQ